MHFPHSSSFGGESGPLRGELRGVIGAGPEYQAAWTPRRDVWMIDAGTRP
jgi:hypothetical protein